MPQHSFANELRGGGASHGNRMKDDPCCEQSSFRPYKTMDSAWNAFFRFLPPGGIADVEQR
jgi:hypothetical protein